MSDPFVPIIFAAAELKRGNPTKYDELVAAMKYFADRARLDLQAADKDHIFTAQGKAQVLDQLARKLEDCFTLDDQYRKRR